MSNTFWIILLIVGIGFMALFLLTDKNFTVADAFIMPAISLVVAVPFAFAFTVLMTRLLSHIISKLIFGTDKEPEKEKYGKIHRLIVEEKFNEAILEIQRILEDEPREIYGRQKMAEIYAEHLKNYSSAIKEYNKVLEMNIDENTRINILNRLADIYEEHLHQPEQAAESLKKIIAGYPDSNYSRLAEARLNKIYIKK